ncbi:hypothetical protein [Shimia ponticola]|uniref:hypothetical protein n=1 Tax=Shimia ponticola TaxID=2582893 RepID=UPI0011BE095C|nr:hypothetical protein [Shimia ponticola]
MLDGRSISRRPSTSDRVALVSCFFNSTGSSRLVENLRAFVDGLGVYKPALHLVECLPPGQRSALDGLDNLHVVHAESVLWQKERLLNLAVESLPDSVEAVVWCDTDIIFADPDWVPQTLEKLQDVDVLQPFRHVAQVPRLGDAPVESYASAVTENPDLAGLRFHQHGHTGYAWGIRRDVIQSVGFFDECVIGGADHVMAHAFTGTPRCDCIPPLLGTESRLQRSYEAWADRLWAEHGPLKMGFLDLDIEHRRHGSDKGRKYLVRNKLLEMSGFDPSQHLVRNQWDCWEWSPSATAQRDLVKAYFSQRKEDVAYDAVT